MSPVGIEPTLKTQKVFVLIRQTIGPFNIYYNVHLIKLKIKSFSLKKFLFIILFFNRYSLYKNKWLKRQARIFLFFNAFLFFFCTTRDTCVPNFDVHFFFPTILFFIYFFLLFQKLFFWFQLFLSNFGLSAYPLFCTYPKKILP